MQLSIIIVNYNVKYFLEQCLCSVVKACANIEAEIWVVDNHSSDGSKAFFANRFPSVHFIWKKENTGFAKANNEALKQVVGDNILFLNPDTIVAEDCFDKCLSFFDKAEKIGALGVRMIDGSGQYLPESKRGIPSPFTSFCKMTGLTKLFPKSRLLARYYLGHLPNNTSNEVDVLSGAFMMINKAVLQKVGSFDETFFMYAEDIDLSYRIQKAGYKNYFFAGTSIIHFKGESTQKRQPRYINNFYGAMALFVKKHYSSLTSTFFSIILQAAIAVKSAQVFVTNVLRNPIQKNIVHGLPTQLFLIGDAVLYKKMVDSLKGFDVQLADKSMLNTTAKAEALVLSESILSFKEIIAAIEDCKQVNWFFINAAGATTLLASNDKNRTGIAIPI